MRKSWVQLYAPFLVLALVAIAALYTLYPVDKDTNGKDIPQARVSQTAPDSGTTGMLTFGACDAIVGRAADGV